jgi:hypothetical protein
MADEPPRRSAQEWTPERVANALVPLRDRLVDRLQGEIAAARGLTRDQCEFVIDEAIDFMVTEYDKPIPDRFSLDRVFWKAASLRVRRVHEQRGATIRAGWQRVELGALELPGDALDPDSATVQRLERQTLLEFAATLTQDERQVLACKYGGDGEQGRRRIARSLGLTPAQVRNSERSIARKLERFAAIIAAGSLCAHREPTIFALAEGADPGDQELVARLHLQHCSACRTAYAAHLHAVRSGALQRRLGQLLPAPTTADLVERRRGGPWASVWDSLTRPFVNESSASVAQLMGAARGAGALVAAKLAAICLAGGLIVGGGVYCVQRLGAHPPLPAARAATPHAHATVEPRLPRPGESAALRISTTRTASKPRSTSTSHRSSGTAFATGPSRTRHEREAPITPATTTTTGAPVAEFGPGPATTSPPAPAAAPSSGAPEFP